MQFERSIYIQNTVEAVFASLQDKHLHQQKPGSPLLLLQKSTTEPVDGTLLVQKRRAVSRADVSFEPLLMLLLLPIDRRLEEIKAVLEGGGPAGGRIKPGENRR